MARGSRRAGAASGPGPGAYVKGLPELRRALRKIDRGLARNLVAGLRKIARRVQDAAKGEARRFRDSGTLERSIRYSVKAKQASIYSNVPYAGVHEYGGTIAPRGVPIEVPRRQYLHAAVSNSRREIDASLESILDEIADAWESRV